MAMRFFMDCGESKCSVYRTGPQFGRWVLWILINILLCLPCLCSTCLGLNITVAVVPEGDIFVQYGQPLEILCVAENYTYNDLEFSVGGKVLPSSKFNSTARKLYIEKPEKQVKTYVCTNNVTNKRCVNRVLVDLPPANVTDFHCLSKNLDELYCSWTSTPTSSYVLYTVTFFINGNTVTLCKATKVKVDENAWYCKWNTTSQPRYRQQEEKYEFQLTSENVFGINKQNITVDHFAVVKPDPPSNLKVSSNGTHSVVLQWSIPHNMVDLLPCGVDHRIEYQIAKIDDTTYFRSVDASSLPPKNKTNRFTINNLPYAHMQYEVRIYIKSKKAPSEGFWSDFSYIVFYTASERPSRPPDTTAGAFEQATFSDKRLINVYWKQLEEYEESGANFTYKVVVSQENSNNTQTLYADKNRSLSFVSLDQASLGAINVRIWSTNMNGSSINSSSLYIPPKKLTHSLTLSSFTKLAYENGTYELSWAGINNIDNYTLFWCQHNSTKICTGRMNFTVLEPHKNNHVIDLPVDNTYQFAISANNGSRTSGMVWAKCDISKDGIAMYGFPVTLNYDAPGKSFVKLTWSMDCTLQNGTIIGYNIRYCPVIRTSSQCDATVGNKSVYIGDPKKMDYNITGLLPFRTYQFTIALNTTYGLKTIENTTAVITTSEDTPTSPRNVTISDVESNSLVVSWDPPLQRNGNIGKYVIYNYNQELYVDKVSGTDVNSRKVNITGLLGFTNYSLTVQACNIPIGLCSKTVPNDAVFVRTKIGPPSKLKAPTIKNNPDKLLWDTPTIPAGTVDLYQVKRVKDQMEPEIFNATDLSLSHCDGVSEAETYQVRAVNFDEDPYHGVLADSVNVVLPKPSSHVIEYPGEWSEPSTVACRSRGGIALTLIFIPLIVLIGVTYGSIKLFKKYKKMEDIKPVLPNGLGIPEKDITKYPFGVWNPTNKDEKPSSDEVLLLPSNNSNVPTSDIKQKSSDICGASDQTDSTGLSDSSRGPVDRQVSTSDESTNSSLHLDIDQVNENNSNDNEQDDETSSSAAESSKENSPYLENKVIKTNPSYVQTVIKPVSGYVQSVPVPPQGALMKTALPTTSSYVMAGLPSPTFTNAVPPINTARQPPSSGYVRPEDVQVRSTLNLGPSLTKALGPESLPSMPSLPPASKHGADSSYIQLQSLPSLKPSLRNTVPLKPPASSGYVNPGDAVINKHLKNIMSAGQPMNEESAILDPAMSPDAYCRFSWSTDPANDNLHSLLSESPTTNAPNNY